MTYTRSLLQAIADEREKYGEPLYTTLKCICNDNINLEARIKRLEQLVQDSASRRQAESEEFWALVEMVNQLPPLVGQNVPHQPGPQEGTGSAPGSGEGR